MEYGELKFGSLDEVIKVDDLVSINEGKGVLEDGSWMCIEQEKTQWKALNPHLPRSSGSAWVKRTTAPQKREFLFCSRFVVGLWGFVLRFPKGL